MELWEKLRTEGWEDFWKEFVSKLDIEGEQNAYEVLGLDKEATHRDAKKAYNKLALKWHPDKWTAGTDAEKAEADKKMSEINAAMETLNGIFDKRKNRKGG